MRKTLAFQYALLSITECSTFVIILQIWPKKNVQEMIPLNINIRSASNFTSVGIYNVMRNINWIDKRARIKLYKCSSIGTSII